MLTDLWDNPELAESIFEIPYQYHLSAAKRLVEMGVDMIWIGDDVGTQRAMLMSPAHWRQYLKPRLANFIASLKAINPDVKVATIPMATSFRSFPNWSISVWTS